MTGSPDSFEDLVDHGNERIRALAEQRGIDWDSLAEEERERLIDDLLHEDQPEADIPG